MLLLTSVGMLAIKSCSIAIFFVDSELIYSVFSIRKGNAQQKEDSWLSLQEII